MQRREFLKTTGVFAGLPIVSMFQSAIAQADIVEANWKVLVNAPFGSVHFQVLWTDLPGVAPESLENLSTVKGASAILYRFSPNFPQRGHWHPKGEYAYVIRGSGSNGDVTLFAGQDSYMPPNSYHPPGMVGPEGIDVFVFTPAPVDFVTPPPPPAPEPEPDLADDVEING